MLHCTRTQNILVRDYFMTCYITCFPFTDFEAESRKLARPTFGTRGREPRSRPAMNRSRAAKGQEGQQLDGRGGKNFVVIDDDAVTAY